MSGAILVGLTILPLSALFFGALFFRQKYKFIHLQTFLIFGVLGMILDLYFFWQTYGASVQTEQWSGVAIAMGGAYPFLMTTNALAFGFVASGFYSLYEKVNKRVSDYVKVPQNYLPVVFIVGVILISYQIFTHQKLIKQTEFIRLASGQLNEQIISSVIESEALSTDKAAMLALLMNPECPSEVLQKYANYDSSKKEYVAYKTAVLRNPNVSVEVVNQLASDTNEVVRYHVVISGKASQEVLQRFLQDSSKDVRLKAKSMLDQGK